MHSQGRVGQPEQVSQGFTEQLRMAVRQYAIEPMLLSMLFAHDALRSAEIPCTE